MGFKLLKPLIFFDIESTGTNTRNDRIIELSTIRINLDQSQEIITQRFNPEIEIPAEATAIHGISNLDIANEANFQSKASQIAEYFQDCDLAGYNIINFDLRLLTAEFLRANVKPPYDSNTKVIDVMRIYHKMEKRDLAAALRFYCDKELENAHQAESDTLAAMEILEKQIERYGLETDVTALDKFCKYEKDINALDFAGKFIRDKDGDIIFNFGSNKGKKVKDNRGMLEWMLPRDFEPHTKLIAEEILAGKLR